MKRSDSLLVGLLLAGTTTLPSISLGDPPVGTQHTATPNAAQRASLAAEFGHLPLVFESNQGQTDPTVRFLSHSGEGTLFLTPSEAVFSMSTAPAVPSWKRADSSQERRALRAAEPRTLTSVRMQMVGSDPRATALQQEPMGGKVNYFLGNDRQKWHTGVSTFGRVGFHGVYPGVDLVYYGNQRHLEYDFVVAPHADPGQIKLHFAGAESVRLNAAGDLVVHAPGRDLIWHKPAVYQRDAKGKHSVAARFRLQASPNGQSDVSFALGRYDTKRTLVIDPVLIYSTYVQGSGNDYPESIAVDSAGNAYITGFTDSADFPTTAGAIQTAKGGFSTAYVAKLNATGTALVYATYLGGASSGGDIGYGIAVDSSGNAYVAGGTFSKDFPTTPGALQTVNRATSDTANAFVAKLNPTGTALLYSTYLGGSAGGYIGDTAYGLAIDSNGNAYVAGLVNSVDFPTTAGAYQTTHTTPTSSPDAFVAELNPTGSALVYATYLGGSGQNTAYGIALDSGNNAYVIGYSTAHDFPTTPGAFQTVNRTSASSNVFVSKLDPTGASLLYSTYIGGTRGDTGRCIAVDSAGNAYVAGVSSSTDYPTTAGAFQRGNNGAGVSKSNAFVTKVNATGTALVYSTYLGGSGSALANAIVVDARGSAYVAGYTQVADFPTVTGSFQRVQRGPSAYTAFLTRFNAAGSALRYSTLLGGSSQGGEQINSLALDGHGSIYLAGQTESLDFPTTPGAYQTTKTKSASHNSIFVTKLSTIPIFPDFNGGGSTSLMIQHSTTNAIASWFMKGSTWLGGAYFSLTPPSDYRLVGTGDFGGNGATTLVLQSKTGNQVAFWYTTGANSATIPGGNFVNATPPLDWKIVGVGDFNGDGKSDLVFQNQTTSQIAIWYMNGPNFTNGVVLPVAPSAGWNVVGVGDFNADGFQDLAFQNQSTGQIALWYMNGTSYTGGTVLSTLPGTGWSVVGVGDYNGDGTADLLFQNQTTNLAAVWYLQNGAFSDGATLSLAPPTGWKIVGPR